MYLTPKNYELQPNRIRNAGQRDDLGYLVPLLLEPRSWRNKFNW